MRVIFLALTLAVALLSGCTAMRLDIGPNKPLQGALATFVAERGYTLDWQVDGGFDSERARTYEAFTVPNVLAQVLPSLGLSADVYTQDRHIIIRPGDTRN